MLESINAERGPKAKGRRSFAKKSSDIVGRQTQQPSDVQILKEHDRLSVLLQKGTDPFSKCSELRVVANSTSYSNKQ